MCGVEETLQQGWPNYGLQGHFKPARENVLSLKLMIFLKINLVVRPSETFQIADVAPIWKVWPPLLYKNLI